MEIGQDRLFRDPALARFYDLDNGWGDDLEYCRGLARDAGSILDLGCGTGLLLSRLAGRRTLVGVDPATAMLEVARKQPGGEGVTWIEADARSLRLDLRFDLIILTGHAFQVFLTDDDQHAVLSVIAEHLAPGGRFIFDSRSPGAEEWREWDPATSLRAFAHPGLGRVEAWNDAAYDEATGIVTYHTHYRAVSSGERFSAESRIRFTPFERIARLLDEVGLAVDSWLGDWHGNPRRAESPEIIPLGHLP